MTRKSRGFTLVELLVVITIIAILMSLVLVAVSRIRGPVIRANCNHNMRQVAMATVIFQQSKGHYPGYVNPLAGRTVPWTVSILPYAGRTDVYRVWSDPSVAAADLPRVVMAIYQCPADPPADRTSPQLSFVANVGASSAVAELPANGLFLDAVNGSAFEGKIIDHQTNTVMFSENRQATIWPNTDRTEIGFMWHPTTSPRPEHHINRGTDLPLSENTARPSSHHDGGVNFAFADTHVQFVDEKMDYKVYMQLMTPDGANSDTPAAWKNYVLNESDY